MSAWDEGDERIRPLAKIVESPLPNPPLHKGREQNFKFPLYKAGVFHSLKDSDLQAFQAKKSGN